MLPCTKNVNAQPRKLSIKLDFGNSNIITDVKRLTYASDWSGSISVGQVVSSYISVSIPTPSFSLAGVNVTLYMGIDDPVEWVQIGNFRIAEETIRTKRISPTKPGYTTFNAYDKLHNSVNTYHSSLTFPATLQQVLNEVCGLIGITSITLSAAENITLQENLLDGYTLRDVLSFIAAYCGKNAYLSPTDTLQFRWFTSAAYTADGTRANIPYIGENDCVLSRWICQNEDGVISAGSGEGIFFTCPFMTSARLQTLQQSQSLTYRKADIDIPYGNFLLQSGDIITVSTTGSNLSVPIMANSWTYDGGVSSSVTSYGVSDYKGTANNAERSLSATRVQRQMAVYRAASDLKIASEKITGASGGYIRINFGGDGKTAALLIMDTEDISTAQNVWVFNQGGLGHFPNGYDPTAQANVALTYDGWVVAERISGTLISGVGIENVDNALTTKPKIELANGCIHFTETYSYDGQTEQVTDIGKFEYLPRSGQNNPATLALTCQFGNNISIGEYGYPKYVYHSQPTGTDKMHHFYGDVRVYGDIEFGGSGNRSLNAIYEAIAAIIDNGKKNLVNSESGSGTRWVDINVELPEGKYTIGFSNITGSAAGSCQLSCYDENWNSTAAAVYIAKGDDVYIANIETTGYTKRFRLYASTNSSTSQGKSISYTNAFACIQAMWDISPRITWYAPSNRELYDMIRNL